MLPNNPILVWTEQSPGVFQSAKEVIGIGKKNWYRIRFSMVVGPILIYWHTEFWDGRDYHELVKSHSLSAAQRICENHAESLASARKLTLGDIVTCTNISFNVEGTDSEGKRFYRKVPEAVVTSLEPLVLKSICGQHQWEKEAGMAFFKVLRKATSKQMERLQG